MSLKQAALIIDHLLLLGQALAWWTKRCASFLWWTWKWRVRGEIPHKMRIDLGQDESSSSCESESGYTTLTLFWSLQGVEIRRQSGGRKRPARGQWTKAGLPLSTPWSHVLLFPRLLMKCLLFACAFPSSILHRKDDLVSAGSTSRELSLLSYWRS